MTTRSRSYVFTLNNYTESDEIAISNIPCKYLIYGREVGENGTRHLQGYIYFDNARFFTAVKKLIPKAHIEAAVGNAAQNRDYCSKEGDFVEHGQIPIKGKRTDISAVKDALGTGRTLRYIMENTSSLQALTYAEKAIKYTEPQRDFMPKVYWFYGPTGSGKSREAQLMCPEAYYCNDSNQWWDGYDAHSEVIIDDFRADFCKFHVLLKIFDQYPHRVQVKGGYRQLLATTMIITSPYSPQDTYATREDIGQLLRRLFLIRFFPSPIKCQEQDIQNVKHTVDTEEKPQETHGLALPRKPIKQPNLWPDL